MCVFDNDPALINRVIDGEMIYPIDRFAEIAKAKNVTVAISTVPSKYSQSAIDEIVKGNVTAILNLRYQVNIHNLLLMKLSKEM